MLKIANYKLWVFLIFIEYLMYENVLFIFPDYFGGNLLKSIVFGYKIIFPLILFHVWKFQFMNFTKINFYKIILFFSFVSCMVYSANFN